MTFWKSLALAFLSAGFACAEDLPLPAPGPLPGTGEVGVLKPTVIAKPPVAPAMRPPTDAREEAIRELERQILQAEAKKAGDTTALRQLIVMQGPVDESLFASPTPPADIPGKVAIIGLKRDEKVVKNLEAFFGVPLTTEREQQLLETVKSQIAGKAATGMDVKVAGWWPKEGVMAVTLVPKSTGS